MRPQPGHAVTCGVKLRMPIDCRICCATVTSSVRSPFGAGVSETRIVSPMPSCSTTAKRRGAADDAFRAHARFGQAKMQRILAAAGQLAIDVDQVLHAADFRAEDDLLRASCRS